MIHMGRYIIPGPAEMYGISRIATAVNKKLRTA